MRALPAGGFGLLICATIALLGGSARAQPEPTAPADASAVAEPPGPPPAAAIPPGGGDPVPAGSAANPAPSAAPVSPPVATDAPEYTEPPRAGGAPDRPPSSRPVPIEPPLPGYGPVYEPPPPPEPKHVAPRNALWLGARASYWMPFGSLWGRCTVYDAAGCLVIETVPMRDFVGAGVALEGDVGARIARAYNLYVAWEHAELGGGSAEFELTDSAGAVTTMPSSRRAATNLYGLGVRFSSNPDRVGLLVDMLVGLRTLEVAWDPAELAPDAPRRLVLGEAPFEFRFAAGADIRLGPMFSVSPLATIGAGTFRSVEWEYADGSRTDALATTDELMDHGWFTLGAGGHFDLGGSP